MGGIAVKNEYLRADSNTACAPVLEVPLEHKYCLTVREASIYTGIGINTLYRKINDPNCDFVLFVQNKRLIKREALEKYIQNKKVF